MENSPYLHLIKAPKISFNIQPLAPPPKKIS